MVRMLSRKEWAVEVAGVTIHLTSLSPFLAVILLEAVAAAEAGGKEEERMLFILSRFH
jgi:hypothetical protein